MLTNPLPHLRGNWEAATNMHRAATDYLMPADLLPPLTRTSLATWLWTFPSTSFPCPQNQFLLPLVLPHKMVVVMWPALSFVSSLSKFSLPFTTKWPVPHLSSSFSCTFHCTQVVYDIKNLVSCLLSPAEYTLWERRWKKHLNTLA